MKQLFILLACIPLTCCTSKPKTAEEATSKEATKEKPKPEVVEAKKNDDLFIKTLTVIGKDRNEAISKVNNAYFEVGLYSYTHDGIRSYGAQLETEKTTTSTKFTDVVNPDGSELRFKNSMEFLNFMDARGYEMKSEDKKKYATEYVFQLKK